MTIHPIGTDWSQLLQKCTGPHLNIKTIFPGSWTWTGWHRDFHYKDKTIMSYLSNGNTYTGKTVYWYSKGASVSKFGHQCTSRCHGSRQCKDINVDNKVFWIFFFIMYDFEMAEWILQIHISVHEMGHYALKVLIQDLNSKHHIMPCDYLSWVLLIYHSSYPTRFPGPCCLKVNWKFFL